MYMHISTAYKNLEFDRVLVWKFNCFARSVSHLLLTLEGFNYFNIRFSSVQYQNYTNSPMVKALFIIIGAMAELINYIAHTSKEIF